ncbi:MAG: radical SAM protein [Defluviitaleaceae bacterium]|nr:radical SAM protein [Defluviitaleaceae bacterium]
MKVSDYNFIFANFSESHDALIYNARSGAMAVLDAENYAKFDNFCKEGLAIEDLELVTGLTHCGFLINENINEKDELRLNMLSNRFATSQLGLVIAPSMDCNFRCKYCFETEHFHRHNMNDNVAAKVVEFISKQAVQLTHLSVTWFGGEPLLDVERIESLSSEFMQICNDNNIKYKSDIITNGFFLTRDIAQRLKDCMVSYAQITLDGVKETHDARRFLADGSGTFDTIIKNLKDSSDILPVALRINVDYENQNQVDEVVTLIKHEGMDNSVSVYLGHVRDYNDSYEENRCLSIKQFSKFNIRFMQDSGKSLESIFPSPKGNYCLADNCQGWVIDPMGDMYKCFADIGVKEKKVFSLLDESNNQPSAYYGYMLFNPLDDAKCEGCKLVPICMGGCPLQREKGTDYCSRFKYNLNEYLVSCAHEILAQ